MGKTAGDLTSAFARSSVGTEGKSGRAGWMQGGEGERRGDSQTGTRKEKLHNSFCGSAVSEMNGFLFFLIEGPNQT